MLSARKLHWLVIAIVMAASPFLASAQEAYPPGFVPGPAPFRGAG